MREDQMKPVVLKVFGLAGVVMLGALAQGCSKTPAATAAATATPAALGLPAEWHVPVRYQGEWHGQLANCANAKDPTRVIIAADHLQINDLAGPVQASSTSGPQLTVVANLTGEGQTLQRVFAFDLSDDNSQLTTIAEQPAVLVRCPATGS